VQSQLLGRPGQHSNTLPQKIANKLKLKKLCSLLQVSPTGDELSSSQMHLMWDREFFLTEAAHGWHTPIMSVLGRLRQEVASLSLGYIVRLVSKKKKEINFLSQYKKAEVFEGSSEISVPGHTEPSFPLSKDQLEEKVSISLTSSAF
jgi:hypothetical protein